MSRHSLPASTPSHANIEHHMTHGRQLRSDIMFQFVRRLWNAEIMTRPW
jgi:hypothetical protein